MLSNITWRMVAKQRDSSRNGGFLSFCNQPGRHPNHPQSRFGALSSSTRTPFTPPYPSLGVALPAEDRKDVDAVCDVAEGGDGSGGMPCSLASSSRSVNAICDVEVLPW